MATFVKRVFLLSVSIVSVVYSIKDGARVNPCDYPGLVAVVAPPDILLCNGIRSGNEVTVPELCGMFIDSMVLPVSDLYVVYGDGTKNVTIPANSTNGTVKKGLYSITPPNTMAPDCNGDAVLVGSDTVDQSSCQVVGYGANSSEITSFDGVLNAAPLIRSTSAPCCHTIYDSLSEDEKRGIPETTAPLNCVSSSGSVCGMGDLGGPVYCNNGMGKKVVVGLTGSTPCVSKGTFVVYDLTGSNSAFKYGIAS